MEYLLSDKNVLLLIHVVFPIYSKVGGDKYIINDKYKINIWPILPSGGIKTDA